MRLMLWATVACLSSTALAFYPYVLPDLEHGMGHDETRRSLARAEGSTFLGLTLPLRRVRRQTNFNIISAVTPTVPNSAGVDQDGTDYSYFSGVQFGTSNQTYYMLLDSGASNTWVMGSNCTSSACKAHKTFGPADSTTLAVSGDTFSIAYGTGSVQGDIGTDTVHIANLSFSLTFGLGQNVSDQFASFPMDGILGLGRGEVSSPAINAPPFIDALKASGLISTSLFGLNLWRDSDGGDNDGEITFGATDASKYTGNITYTAALPNDDGFWEIPLDASAVDGKVLDLGGQRTALVDSGTSFILVPPGDAAKLFAQIDGSSQSGETYTVPCDWQGTVSLTFSNVTYNISYLDVVGRDTGSGQCTSNIIGRQTFGATQWLVGDVFLKNVYSVFDLDSSSVGFAAKAASNSTSAGSATSSGSPGATGSNANAPDNTGAAPPASTTSSSSPTTSAPAAGSDSAGQLGGNGVARPAVHGLAIFAGVLVFGVAALL